MCYILVFIFCNPPDHLQIFSDSLVSFFQVLWEHLWGLFFLPQNKFPLVTPKCQYSLSSTWEHSSPVNPCYQRERRTLRRDAACIVKLISGLYPLSFGSMCDMARIWQMSVLALIYESRTWVYTSKRQFLSEKARDLAENVQITINSEFKGIQSRGCCSHCSSFDLEPEPLKGKCLSYLNQL